MPPVFALPQNEPKPCVSGFKKFKQLIIFIFNNEERKKPKHFSLLLAEIQCQKCSFNIITKNYAWARILALQRSRPHRHDSVPCLHINGCRGVVT